LDHFLSGSLLRSRSWIPARGFYIFKMVPRENSFMYTGAPFSYIHGAGS